MLYEAWERPCKATDGNGETRTLMSEPFPFLKPIIFLKLLSRLAIKWKRSLIFLMPASRRILGEIGCVYYSMGELLPGA